MSYSEDCIVISLVAREIICYYSTSCPRNVRTSQEASIQRTLIQPLEFQAPTSRRGSCSHKTNKKILRGLLLPTNFAITNGANGQNGRPRATSSVSSFSPEDIVRVPWFRTGYRDMREKGEGRGESQLRLSRANWRGSPSQPHLHTVLYSLWFHTVKYGCLYRQTTHTTHKWKPCKHVLIALSIFGSLSGRLLEILKKCSFCRYPEDCKQSERL